MSRRFDNNNNNNNNCNSNIFVTYCQIAWCWKHMQLQRFAAAWNWLIHQIPERKDLYNDCNNVALFSNVYQLSRSMRTFSKHHHKCKTVSTKFIARKETANIKIFTGKSTKQFCLLFWLKSWSAREASHHSAFMGNCWSISHKFYSPNYPADEGNDDVGLVSDNILLFLELFDF